MEMTPDLRIGNIVLFSGEHCKVEVVVAVDSNNDTKRLQRINKDLDLLVITFREVQKRISGIKY